MVMHSWSALTEPETMGFCPIYSVPYIILSQLLLFCPIYSVDRRRRTGEADNVMLIGIAKMAAESELLEAKRQVEYRQLEARSYISRNSGLRMPFEWTINPYRGCEIACRYCYARYTHEFMELDPGVDFETKIFAKEWNEVGFRRELRIIPRHEVIVIGTATDPYQPAERRFEVTRKMLQVFKSERSRRFGLITKSDLITRDVELLKAIAEHNSMHVTLTITTTDEALARSVEPRAPRPELRFAALRKLADAGLQPGISIAPLLPLINDSEASIDAVARSAKQAGAVSLTAGLLFLKPTTRSVFFPWLDANYPSLAARYRERFAASDFLRGDYVRLINARVQAIRKRYDLTEDPRMLRHGDDDPQLNLFSAAAECVEGCNSRQRA